MEIISAVVIFVVGQMSLKLIIEPIQELKKEIAEVLNVMVFYADSMSNPNTNSQEIIDEVSQILRKHASNLEAKYSIIPFYKIFEIFRVLPSKDNVSKAKSLLIGLSNSLGQSEYDSGIENAKSINKVKKIFNNLFNFRFKDLIVMILIIIFLIIFFLSIELLSYYQAPA